MKGSIWGRGWLLTAILTGWMFAGLQAQDADTTTTNGNGETKNGRNGKKLDYEQLTAQASVDKGLFTVYVLDKDYYFEINDTLLGRDMLLAARVASVSNSSKVSAGQMLREPVMIRFSRDEENVYLHQVVSNYMAVEEDPVSLAVARTSMDPIMKTFHIAAFNQDSSAAIFDVTKFFSEEIPAISPFNAKYKAGKLEKDATRIIEALSFPGNTEIRTFMNYSNAAREPFSIVMHRSLLLLPEEPMMPRLEDPRIGYFATGMMRFATDTVGVESLSYIHRFRMEPTDEDRERYLSGMLVEPANPIVFYVDDAFPEAWREYVKKGIEDWQPAFEAIGFKNAIVARDFPVDDPEFHPEDIRFSCVRYISQPKANSQGPRWIDPRSGEVLGGDVLWWHNVTELLRDWRFVQTAAADREARKRNPDMEMLGEMIRYVSAHELGHVLGLKHNMRASYAFPVDSLRSGTFTQAHGTTPSIMDYARFNYIAQPGDEDIRFTPPDLGPYDIYAIEWGYRPVPGAKSPGDELPTLNEWILAKAGDPVYHYGDQQMGSPVFDPASQNEALGDDAILASTYGVSNAKYIMDHLVDWTTFENEDFEYLHHMYEELLKQYNRYVGHVLSYLGGVYVYKPVEGEDTPKFTPVSRTKQEAALEWLFGELGSQHQWILDTEIEKRLGTKKGDLLKEQSETLDKVMSVAIYQRLHLFHEDYSCQDYLDDVYAHVWKKTLAKGTLNEFDRNLQVSYVRNLLTEAGMDNGNGKKSSLSSGLTSPAGSKVPSLDNLVLPLLHLKVEETKKMLKKHLKAKDPVLRAHYTYLYNLL